MNISYEPEYIALTFDMEGNNDFVSFFSHYNEVLKSWDTISRVSPIFKLYLKEEIDEFNIKENYYLLFFGPFSPAKLDARTFSKANIWIGYGFYNIICAVKFEDVKNIKSFLEKNNIRYEQWKVDNQIIKNRKLHPINKKEDVNVPLFDFSQYNISDILYSPLREFSTISMAGLQRIKGINEVMRKDFDLIIRSVYSYVCMNETDELSKFGFLTTMNACLSRFTSQSLSGISPINRTESHLWGHSFLGIGVANLALFNIANFISNKIAKANIPDLFEKFINDNSKTYRGLLHNRINCDDTLWAEDKLKKFIDNISELSDNIPSITYFSGRDGFRNQYNTLSVPLESLYSCNTSGASLKTITHEMSHVIIRACLAKILMQDEYDEDDNIYASKLAEKNFENLREELKYFIIKNILYYSRIKNIPNDKNINNIISENYREIEEIMTHTFDYMYFYNFNTQSYLSELWSTWSEIPKIENRMKEYVNRSICALMSDNIRSVNCVDEARSKFIEVMILLKEKEKNEPLKLKIIENAINLVENYWNKEGDPSKYSLYDLAKRSRDFVRFVRTFLFSDGINSIFRFDDWQWNKGDRGAIKTSLRELKLGDYPIGNLLSFIDEVSQSKKRSMAESILIYYNLAFNYYDDVEN